MGGPYNATYPLYSTLNPLQQLHFNGMVLQNTMLQAQLNHLSSAPAQAQSGRTVQASNTLNVQHNLDNATISLLGGMCVSPPPATSRVVTEGNEEACTGEATALSRGEDARFKSYENIRASMLRTVHPEIRSEKFKAASAAERMQRRVRFERSSSRQQVMRLKNEPLSSGLISWLAEQRSVEEERDVDVDAEE
ncbi:uncharacterized protein N7458_009891 [Penicillium daleae]|uniref:Uncharacterized protein n=1 Tax=Penicillium daleae TaxID=63821 RepID=A0AAD6BZB1_9EURO|nr:uncharacterized protein N7458_009891 [Penicillium daleae]KAJ5438893.1 hypothetical protein N7458_009891 [Penicillium daleae]